MLTKDYMGNHNFNGLTGQKGAKIAVFAIGITDTEPLGFIQGGALFSYHSKLIKKVSICL